MTLTILLFWISEMAFPQLGNFADVVISVPTDFPSKSKQGWSICIAYGYSLADWDGLCSFLIDVPWKSNFQCSASAASSKFCECFQVRI